MTIQLFQPPQMPDAPGLSMFCVKTEILLKLSGLSFETVVQGDPREGPKQKFPYIGDNGKTVGDSSFIEMYLNENHAINFYAGVDELDVARARIITSAIEEQLYWVTVYSRWQMDENWPIMEKLFFGSMPPEMREPISKMARDSAIRSLWGHGMGRHSVEEVYTLGRRLIDNLSVLLGDRKYFAADKITTVDASAYGALINFIQNPVPTPLKAHILTKPNLCAFLNDMSEQFFPEAERAATDLKSVA